MRARTFVGLDNGLDVDQRSSVDCLGRMDTEPAVLDPEDRGAVQADGSRPGRRADAEYAPLRTSRIVTGLVGRLVVSRLVRPRQDEDVRADPEIADAFAHLRVDH
jgi:hypothetical protein